VEWLNTTIVSFDIIVAILVSLAKTRRVGGSLVITQPKELVESKKIKEGEIVEITVEKVRKVNTILPSGLKETNSILSASHE